MKDKYLGDGVYASYDGYQILLAVNHHENKVVALEPNVMVSLVQYANSVFRREPASADEKDPDT